MYGKLVFLQILFGHEWNVWSLVIYQKTMMIEKKVSGFKLNVTKYYVLRIK